MEYNKNELILIEQCGNCQLSLDEIAMILEKDPNEIKQEFENRSSSLFRRYNKGRFLAELKVRQSIYSMATQGSVQAQVLWLKMRDDLKIGEA